MGRITYDRRQAQFSCKLSCIPSLWNARERRLSGKSREAIETNTKLERLLLSIYSAYQRLEARGGIFTVEDIKAQFQGSMQIQITFLDRYDRMLKEMEQKVGIEIKATTMSSYYTIRKHLQLFIGEKYHTTDIPFGQIEEDFLECLQHYSLGKLGHSQGHYRTMALAVKKVCRLSYREDLTERQLLAHVQIERGENKQPRALDKLLELTFELYEVELETARNLFLFSCYPGVAYCDMVALNREHLFTNDEGALWLKFRRQKTNTLCRVKLLSEAVRLIERYQSEECSTLFAPIAYSAYLVQLKALQLRTDISIPLSAYVGRHTFATLITLERGVSIETVSRMLGHSNIQTTEEYAYVTLKRLFDEFERFLSFIEDL